jgi:hypothetical protein
VTLQGFEEVTAQTLLESYLPASLKLTDEQVASIVHERRGLYQ